VRFDYGLTGVTISDGVRTAAIYPSTLHDELGTLLHAVWRMLEGDPRATCSWEAEPGEYQWIFDRVGATVQVQIVELPGARPRLPNPPGTVLFETSQPAIELARAIALGASRTLAEHGSDGYATNWRHNFPERTLELIQAKLNA